MENFEVKNTIIQKSQCMGIENGGDRGISVNWRKQCKLDIYTTRENTVKKKMKGISKTFEIIAKQTNKQTKN